MMPGTAFERLATAVPSNPPPLRHVRNVKSGRHAHSPTGGRPIPGTPHKPATPLCQPVTDSLSSVSNLAARGGDDLMDATPDVSSSNGPEINAEKWFDHSNRNVLNNRNLALEDRKSEPSG
jgi:hypothetical protein